MWRHDPAVLLEFDVFAALARGRPKWHQQAACRGQGPDGWFPPPGTEPKFEALAVCAACPVREPCASAGTVERGTWGGISEARRRRDKRLPAA